jgi:ComF family protein
MMRKKAKGMNDACLLKKSRGQTALEMVYDGIFPNKCLFCKKVLDDARETACEDCRESALFVHDFRDDFFENIGKVYVAYDYDAETVRDAVMRFKYGGKRLLAGKMAGGIFGCLGNFDEPIGDFLVCVPLHEGRMKERGYNQAALLALELSGLYGLPAYDGMMRVRETAKQFDLGPKERIENVSGAFALKEGFCVEGRDILLVDDVLTTGATVMECGRALIKAGAKSVNVVAFAAVL